MTKLRGYIPTMLMLVTVVFGTTAANAGIITGGRTADSTSTATCGETTTLTGLLSEFAAFASVGIITGGRDGIITGGRDGIITGGREATCSTENFGIITGG